MKRLDLLATFTPLLTLIPLIFGTQLWAQQETSSADDRELALTQALEEYERALGVEERSARLASFQRAQRRFGELVRAGIHNADLYTNQGNAALQAENLAAAILAYRNALALDPDHERAQQNLTHARTLLPRWVPSAQSESVLDTFFFWHRSLSRAERGLWAAALFAFAITLLAIAVRMRNRLVRNIAIFLLLCWAALLVSLLIETDPDDAVISAPEVVARSADSAHAQSRFAQPLPGGTEVTIVEERERWTQIELADGRDAWVPAQSVTRVLVGGSTD